MMANVTIINVSTYKIGINSNKNKCLATFVFDDNIQEYSVNVMGSSYDTGTVADSHSLNIATTKYETVLDLKSKTVKDLKQIDASVNITAEIDSSELYQEGDNRVNIYGKDMSGNWTLYGI